MAKKKDFRPAPRLEAQYRREIEKLITEYLKLPAKASLTTIQRKLAELASNRNFLKKISQLVSRRMVTMLNRSNARSWQEAAGESSRGRVIYLALREGPARRGWQPRHVDRQPECRAHLLDSRAVARQRESPDRPATGRRVSSGGDCRRSDAGRSTTNTITSGADCPNGSCQSNHSIDRSAFGRVGYRLVPVVDEPGRTRAQVSPEDGKRLGCME